MNSIETSNYSIYNEDCSDGMQRIKDHCIDMILCDLPNVLKIL